MYKRSCEVHFRLLGTNGIHVKAENKRFSAAGSRCRQNLKYENFKSSFGRLRQKFASKGVLHVLHDYFPHPANQIHYLWRCRCHCGRRCVSSRTILQSSTQIDCKSISLGNNDQPEMLEVKRMTTTEHDPNRRLSLNFRKAMKSFRNFVTFF